MTLTVAFQMDPIGAIDITGDGTISKDDLPAGLGLKNTHTLFNKHTSTAIQVVPLPGYESKYKPSLDAKIAQPTYEAETGHSSFMAQCLTDHEEEGEETAEQTGPKLTGLAKHRDAFMALGSVIIYIGFGCSYYSTKGEVPWSFGEVVYFTMATITTVGYGDFNGSNSSSAMIFTCVYAFMGVGIVSLAIGELLETAREMKMQAEHAALEQMAAELKKAKAGGTIDESKKDGITKKFVEWAQKNALTRCVIVLLPMTVV